MTERKKFLNKVCLITGAGSGIGRATAIKMSSLGACLALSDINESAIEETRRLCETGSTDANLESDGRGGGGGGGGGGGERVGKIITEAVDVQSSTDVQEHVDRVANGFHGRIDFVFNCAGVNPTASALTDTTDEYFDRLVNTNLRGTYNMTRAAIPHLETDASIVNVSSVLGLYGAANAAIYCATKFAIVGFTKAMALELGPKGVRCNAVAPGFIDTPTNAGVVEGPEAVEAQTRQVALGRMGTAEEIADVVAFLFSPDAKYMNGSIVEVTGGKI